MSKVFFIALGGAFGAVSRYYVSGWAQHVSNSGFPWGTMAVNLGGSLVIGLLWAISESAVMPQHLRMLLFVGILGSFTTFSTFSLENFHLIRDGEYVRAMVNIFASVIGGLACVFVGYFFIRSLKGG